MENIENLSLAKIVTLKPQAAVVFEKYNLDFCCGGKQTLAKSVADNSERLQIITKELNELFVEVEGTSAVNFNEISLSDLIVYILNTHHQFVRKNLPLIEMHLLKSMNKHGERHPSLIKIAALFNEVKQEMEDHMAKEEEVLFPRIMAMETAFKAGIKSDAAIQLLAPIHVMEEEHEAVGKMLDEIRKLSWNYSPPMDACTTFRLSFEELKMFEEDLHIHVHLENNILFPRSIEMQKMVSGVIVN